MSKRVVEKRASSQSRKRPSNIKKRKIRVTLKSSLWYQSAAQSISINGGRRYLARDAALWVPHAADERE
jgi:hypothetical protein